MSTIAQDDNDEARALFDRLAGEIRELESAQKQLQLFQQTIVEAKDVFSKEEIEATAAAVAERASVISSKKEEFARKVRCYEQEVQAVAELIAKRKQVLESDTANDALKDQSALLQTFVVRQTGLTESLNRSRTTVFGHPSD